jgi:pentatricopeptide repeat protein
MRATTTATTRVCALNGDMERTRDVLHQIKANGIKPTPNT